MAEQRLSTAVELGSYGRCTANCIEGDFGLEMGPHTGGERVAAVDNCSWLRRSCESTGKSQAAHECTTLRSRAENWLKLRPLL